MGSTAPSSCPMRHHSFTGRHLRRRSPPRAIQGHHRLLLRPKPSSGLFRPTRSPPVRLPAPGMAPWTLALILDRLSGRPSFSPSPTIGASALVVHIPRRAFPSQSCHRSAADTGNPGFTADSGVIAPAGADQLRQRLQAAVDYFGPSYSSISAAASPSIPWTGLTSPPRTLPAPSTTNVYGRLRLQQRPYRPRKPHRHRFALGAP